MQKFYGKVTDSRGNPIVGARLTVYLANVVSPLPVLFSEDGNGGLTSSSNPVLTNGSGEYSFVAQSGEYQIKATGSSAVLNITKTVTEYSTSTAEPIVPVTLNRQVFTDSATWTAPNGVIQATVTCVGAGGGGGGGSSNAGASGGGPGGGGGATIRRTVTVNPLSSYSIVINAAGIGGTGAGVAGTDGGSTKFGTLVEATGGKGGGSSSGSGTGTPGSGGNGTLVGIGGGGTIAFTTTAMSILNGYGAAISGSTGGGGGSGTIGSNGSSGNPLETYAGGLAGAGNAVDKGGGGGGGSSAFGTGGTGGSYGGTSAQPPGVFQYGAGGGGGAALATGAAGSKGLCIVEWIS